MIPISDLRKGNLIKTEYGILPVHALIFNEVQVKGKDGRILWAKEIEGVELSEFAVSTLFSSVEFRGKELSIQNCCFEYFREGLCYSAGEGCVFSEPIKLIHELQNIYYWIERKELKANE